MSPPVGDAAHDPGNPIGEETLPFPIGHTAVGLAVLEAASPSGARPRARWKTVLWTAVLANLPDLDILAGLLWSGNGAAFHRGPTHSLAFAAAAALATLPAARRLPSLGAVSPGLRFGLVLSHLVSDLLLSRGPVSLFWPFQMQWSAGSLTWTDTIAAALRFGVSDAALVAAAAGVVATARYLRRLPGTPRRVRTALGPRVDLPPAPGARRPEADPHRSRPSAAS